MVRAGAHALLIAVVALSLVGGVAANNGNGNGNNNGNNGNGNGNGSNNGNGNGTGSNNGNGNDNGNGTGSNNGNGNDNGNGTGSNNTVSTGCNTQAGCSTFAITEYPSASTCSSSGCEFKVCMQVDANKPGCALGGGTVELMCTFGGADVCPPEFADGNYRPEYASHDITDFTLHEECVYAAAGETVTFVLKDGNTCGEPLTAPVDDSAGVVSAAGLDCAARTAAFQTCTGGNGNVGKECLWTVTMPDCSPLPSPPQPAASDAALPSPSPASPPQPATSDAALPSPSPASPPQPAASDAALPSPSPASPPQPATSDAGLNQGSSSARVFGDPHFIGFDGSQFDYQGFPSAMVSLISTPTAMVNCVLGPELIHGLTYMSAVGVATAGQRLRLAAYSGHRRIVATLNDANIDLMEPISLAAGALQVKRVGDEVHVKTAELELLVAMRAPHPDVMFLDLNAVKLSMMPASIHGVLGRTAAPALSDTAIVEEDFLISSLFDNDCKYNVYQGEVPRPGRANPHKTVAAAALYKDAMADALHEPNDEVLVASADSQAHELPISA